MPDSVEAKYLESKKVFDLVPPGGYWRDLLDESRLFTTREYARIQSFPDTRKFAGKMNDIYKQIDNAVQVNLAKCTGIEIMNALNER